MLRVRLPAVQSLRVLNRSSRLGGSCTWFVWPPVTSERKSTPRCPVPFRALTYVGPQRAAAMRNAATSALIHSGPGAESLIEASGARQWLGRSLEESASSYAAAGLVCHEVAAM